MKHDSRTILVFGLLIFALYSSDPTRVLPSVPHAYGATQNLVLTGDTVGGIPYWNGTTSNRNPTITVSEGDSVSVALKSTDAFLHQLYIDVDRDYPRTNFIDSDKLSPEFTSPITYNFTVDFPAGTYTYYCSLHPVTMVGTFNVRGFTVTSNPNSLTIIRGTSGSSSITLNSFNGFTGTASLTGSSSPTGPNVSFNPNNFNLPADGTASSTMSVNVPSTTPPGSYSLSVNATIGNISHVTTKTLTVKKPSFSLSANPSRLIILQGSSKTATVTVSSLNTFNGTATLANATSLPAGISLIFNPKNVTVTTGQSATSTLNVTVALSVASGDYNLTLNGVSGSETNSTVLMVTAGRDFTISANPSFLTFTQASSGNSTITLASVNGFSGNVTLSSTGAASGLTVSFNSTIISLPSGATRHALGTISSTSSTTASNYNVSITGTNSTRIRSLVLKISITGFTIQTSQESLNVTQGLKAAFKITLTSLNGFSGTINLSISGNAYVPGWSLTQTSAILASGLNLNITATFATSEGTGLTLPGTYLFNMTGVSGPITHWIALTVTVVPPLPSPVPNTTPIAFIAGSVLVVALVAVLTLFYAKRRARKKSTVTPKAT